MFEENSLTVLLASFFYTHGYLRIAGLGSFQLKEGTAPVTDEHGDQLFPEGSIMFTYQAEEKIDPELIGFILERSRKMKALATADIISLADAARELLNIGQSYTLTGIAKVMPLGNCKFQVVPTMIFPNFLESGPRPGRRPRPAPKAPKVPKVPLARPPKRARVHSQVTNRSIGGMAILGICLAITGLLVYFLFFTDHPATADRISVPQAYSAARPDTAASAGTAEKDGLLHYEVIFERAGRSRALHRYRQLTGWGHEVVLHTRDSVRYTLAIPVATAAADTEAVKDSIRILYGHPVYIRYLGQ